MRLVCSLALLIMSLALASCGDPDGDCVSIESKARHAEGGVGCYQVLYCDALGNVYPDSCALHENAPVGVCGEPC